MFNTMQVAEDSMLFDGGPLNQDHYYTHHTRLRTLSKSRFLVRASMQPCFLTIGGGGPRKAETLGQMPNLYN